MKYGRINNNTQLHKGASHMLNLEEIKQLINEIDKSSINEFSYEKDDVKIKLKKADNEVEHVQQLIQQVPEKTESITLGAKSATQTELVDDVVMTPQHEIKEDTGIKEIVSPMVGTFYRKPSPDSENYVEIGDKVDETTVVCIVEAMKLFNEIEAELTGEITDLLVEDGELVEYGQPLFKVKVN